MSIDIRSGATESHDVNLDDRESPAKASTLSPIAYFHRPPHEEQCSKGNTSNLQSLLEGRPQAQHSADSSNIDSAIQKDRDTSQIPSIHVVIPDDPTQSGCPSVDERNHCAGQQVIENEKSYSTASNSIEDAVQRRDDRHVRKTGHIVKKPRYNTTKQKIPQTMQAQWRIGMAPSAALALSREEKQISKILSEATAYHNSMFEVFWGPGLRHNRFIHDLDNRVEIFRDSSVTAACLMAANRPHLAQEVLHRVLPGMDDLLRNPHPSLYLILAELALGLVKTPDDSFRDQIARYMASRAFSVLGPDHPLTSLLTVQLPPAAKEALGERLWKSVLPILARTFGDDHYQSTTQVFCHARIMASCGRSDEAINILDNLLDYWSQLYGGNSLIVCYSKIELANMLIGTGSTMKAEFVASDALRTCDMIHATELRNEGCHASEKRHRESSIAFPKVAALRTLGKIHSSRGNFGTALYYCSQAIAIGAPSLGANSSVVELAQHDLDKVRYLQLRPVMNERSFDKATKLTDIIASPVC